MGSACGGRGLLMASALPAEVVLSDKRLTVLTTWGLMNTLCVCPAQGHPKQNEMQDLLQRWDWSRTSMGKLLEQAPSFSEEDMSVCKLAVAEGNEWQTVSLLFFVLCGTVKWRLKPVWEWLLNAESLDENPHFVIGFILTGIQKTDFYNKDLGLLFFFFPQVIVILFICCDCSY